MDISCTVMTDLPPFCLVWIWIYWFMCLKVPFNFTWSVNEYLWNIQLYLFPETLLWAFVTGHCFDFLTLLPTLLLGLVAFVSTVLQHKHFKSLFSDLSSSLSTFFWGLGTGSFLLPQAQYELCSPYFQIYYF